MAFTSHPGGATHEISRLRHPDAALSRALGRVAGHLHAWPTPRSQARCRTRGPRLAPATRVNRRSPATLARSSGLSRCGRGSQAWRPALPDAMRRALRDERTAELNVRPGAPPTAFTRCSHGLEPCAWRAAHAGGVAPAARGLAAPRSSQQQQQQKHSSSSSSMAAGTGLRGLQSRARVPGRQRLQCQCPCCSSSGGGERQRRAGRAATCGAQRPSSVRPRGR